MMISSSSSDWLSIKYSTCIILRGASALYRVRQSFDVFEAEEIVQRAKALL